MDTTTPKPLGRNEPCHCDSGKKYKHCCLAKDEAAARQARAAAQASNEAAAGSAPAEDDAEKHGKHRAHPAMGQETRRGGANTRGFQKAAGVRKVGGS